MASLVLPLPSGRGGIEPLTWLAHPPGLWEPPTWAASALGPQNCLDRMELRRPDSGTAKAALPVRAHLCIVHIDDVGHSKGVLEPRTGRLILLSL